MIPQEKLKPGFHGKRYWTCKYFLTGKKDNTVLYACIVYMLIFLTAIAGMYNFDDRESYKNQFWNSESKNAKMLTIFFLIFKIILFVINFLKLNVLTKVDYLMVFLPDFHVKNLFFF